MFTLQYIIMAKTIELSRGLTCIVSDIDADLDKFAWCAGNLNSNKPDVFYAMRTIYLHPGRKSIYMARQILERILDRPLIKNEICDHINGDTLDNRRTNLRLSTKRENCRNMGKTRREGTTSEYKGVYWHKLRNKWVASIRVDGKLLFLGYYKDEKQAAKEYDKAALKYFQEFAKLNFPEDQSP